MRPPEQAAPKAAQRWRRDLIAILIAANVSALLFNWASYPPLTRWLNRGHILGWGWADFLEWGFGIVSLLVLPGLISARAARWTFLWALLVAAFTTVHTVVESLVEQGNAEGLWAAPAVVLLGAAMSAGPISFIRFCRRMAREQQQAAQAAFLAWQQAPPQEGVWPPPPQAGDDKAAGS